MASCSGVIPMTSSGSSAANWGSSPACLAVIFPAVAIWSANARAMSLNARYCRQPREEQVACLDEGEVVVVGRAGLGQRAGRP